MKKITLLLLSVLFLFGLSLNMFPNVYAGLSGSTYDVEVRVIYGDGNEQTLPLAGQSFGQNISIDLSAFSAYDFVYFIANGEIVGDYNAEFKVNSDLNIIAVLKTSGQEVATFIDSNGEYIDSDYVLTDDTPVAPDVSAYSKAGYSVDTENPWSPSISTLTDDQIYTLQYNLNSVSTYIITATNGTSSNDTPAFNEVVTVTASSGTAGYWTEDDIVVAYGTTYTFTALASRSLVWNESSDNEVPVLSLVDVSGIRNGYSSFLGQVYLPDGYEAVEFGFLFDSDEEIALTVDNAETIKVSTASNYYNEFLRSVQSGSYKSARAYAVVDNGTSFETIYSDILVFSVNSGASELFISEYIEGSSNNKAIEIYNGTGSDVDLSEYSVEVYYNGGTSPNNINLTGTLPNGETYIVYNSSAVSTIKNASSYYLSSGSATWNGDDVVALLHSGTIIDKIGIIGTDPGSNWLNYNSDYTMSTSDNTIVRNADVTGPKTSFDGSEWTQYAIDYFDNTGMHTMTAGSSSSSTTKISEFLDLVETDFNAPSETLEISENYTLPTTSLYGASVEWNVTLGSTYINALGEVTRPANGVGDQAATLEYTITVGDKTIVGYINFIILQESLVEATGLTETFDNLDYSGGSYASGSFVGDNSITWTYANSRGDFDLEGNALMLKGSTGQVVSSTISGGISSFTVQFYDAYSGAAELELYINDVLIATSITHDGDSDNTPVTFTVENINISGDFTIKLVATDSQTVIDNITWLGYSE